MEVIGAIWTTVIIEPMINSLVLLYSIFFLSFGITIAVFTVLIRAAMFPLTVKQSRALKAMTALQPRLKDIQTKYTDNREKRASETMKVYKEAGVNPIGCLGPFFIQFPIWIGLYQAIIQTLPSTPESLVGLSGRLYSWLPMVHEVVPLESSFLWLDLARPDSTPVLPVAVGASMFIMQKMTTMPTADPRQQSTNKMMLWMMPLMFGFFTTTFPSGLAVYWVISNIVGVVMQGFITGWGPLMSLNPLRRRSAEPEEAPPPAPAAEEITDDERDRDNGEDSGRGDRARVKGARRRSGRRRSRRH